MIVSSILFEKKIWTKNRAHVWLKQHRFYPIKPVLETENFYHYKINEAPETSKFRTLKMTESVKVIVAL